MKGKDAMVFRTEDGIVVPAVTAEQMREMDRIAVEEFGLGILQMMENAGRSLALNVMEMLDSAEGEVTVLVGPGGNGGGGLCCARHLHNRGFKVWVLLDRENVLPSAVRARVAVEAGIELGWEHYVGLEGAVVGMQGFGASAPREVLYEKFGITVANVAAKAKALLGR
jgi:NAD(P)H-hydrate repair Nnr-like enzyme with NAD(P)H-hydrate epimerase domain